MEKLVGKELKELEINKDDFKLWSTLNFTLKK